MDTKNVFVREISWVQMNKDNIKAAISNDVEQKIAMKLSILQDESDHFENDDTREVWFSLWINVAQTKIKIIKLYNYIT